MAKIEMNSLNQNMVAHYLVQGVVELEKLKGYNQAFNFDLGDAAHPSAN